MSTIEHLESILNTLGSSASTKNEYGVTNIGTSNDVSSMVFKPLNNTKSDTIELLKVIDTNINELFLDPKADNWRENLLFSSISDIES